MAIESPYIKIAKELAERICCGVYRGSLPSISRLSTEFKVCDATIKRTMSQLRDWDLVDGQQGKCVLINPKALGNPFFRRRIVVFAPMAKVYNPFYGSILDHLNTSISSVYACFNLFVSLEQLKECGFRPDLLIAVDILPSSSLLQELSGYVIPERLILLNQMHSRYHYISTDNFRAGYAAIAYLAETCGHRHIGFLASQLQYSEACLKKRHDGALQYASEHPELVLTSVEIPDKGIADEYLPWVEKLYQLDPEISAIFGSTDLIAVSVYAYATKYKLNIPEDLAVLGFDNQRYSRTLYPPLSTFSEKSDEMGRHLFELAKQLLICKSPAIPQSRMIILPELLIRQSTGRENIPPTKPECT